MILAIWLPLLSGNALAVSTAWQPMGGDRHSVVAQQGEPHALCSSTVQQHTQYAQLAADQDQSAGPTKTSLPVKIAAPAILPAADTWLPHPSK